MDGLIKIDEWGTGFDYNQAFYINTGLLSEAEQERLRNASVTVVGMFAGGVIAIMLARAGVESFTLIDDKRYKLSDMNRDAGCYIDNIGRYKAEVISEDIKRINPGASVNVVTDKLSLEAIKSYIGEADVYFAQSDDIAFSCHSLMIAQEMKKFAITFMPSGLTGYVEVYPPGAGKVIDPAVLFGSPTGMSYKKLFYFLRNPLNRCGRRWHITEGKWRIDWFEKWRQNKAIETQICPNIWLGAGLAATEAIKYITGKWENVRVPYMWHQQTAKNQIKIEKFRRRSWWFEKFINWTFGVRFLDLGRKYRKYTSRRLLRELDSMKKQEEKGEEMRLPFMWRHLI